MKNVKQLAISAIILPAFVLSSGAYAESHSEGSDMDDEQGSGLMEDKKTDRNENQSLGMDTSASYMTSTPNNGIRVEDVIGSALHIQSSDDEVGNISDLIIDESGQVVAVILDVGGFLGMGERPVAVSWDSIERTMNEDRNGYQFTVNSSEEALRDAPEYDVDSTGFNN